MKFEGWLEIGGLALIVGCEKPENSWVIGKIVTIEVFNNLGDDITWLFPTARFVQETYPDMVVCSGVDSKSVTSHGQAILPNHLRINKKYLMPLPPLEEEELQKEKELEY